MTERDFTRLLRRAFRYGDRAPLYVMHSNRPGAAIRVNEDPRNITFVAVSDAFNWPDFSSFRARPYDHERDE